MTSAEADRHRRPNRRHDGGEPRRAQDRLPWCSRLTARPNCASRRMASKAPGPPSGRVVRSWGLGTGRAW